jgi:monofunctional biosynthetic peptidoglycan transglycosylase
MRKAPVGKGRHAGNHPVARHALRLGSLVLLCFIALQLAFGVRIALMAVLAPQSTAFQRSEAWRLLVEKHRIAWSQDNVDSARISPHLQRAVIASEDAGFVDHSGIEWDAIEKAWQKNQQAEQRVNKTVAARPGKPGRPGATPPVAKVVGGSTITQQLAKNLFLSGERTAVRKAQEALLTVMLETALSKERILSIYLNNVEWGEGVFGAQAAARHYFRVDAARLGPEQAARLAVMLPAPKRFEKNPGSPYVAGRAATIVARMGGVTLP